MSGRDCECDRCVTFKLKFYNRHEWFIFWILAKLEKLYSAISSFTYISVNSICCLSYLSCSVLVSCHLKWHYWLDRKPTLNNEIFRSGHYKYNLSEVRSPLFSCLSDIWHFYCCLVVPSLLYIVTWFSKKI